MGTAVQHRGFAAATGGRSVSEEGKGCLHPLASFLSFPPCFPGAKEKHSKCKCPLFSLLSLSRRRTTTTTEATFFFASRSRVVVVVWGEEEGPSLRRRRLRRRPEKWLQKSERLRAPLSLLSPPFSSPLLCGNVQVALPSFLPLLPLLGCPSYRPLSALAPPSPGQPASISEEEEDGWKVDISLHLQPRREERVYVVEKGKGVFLLIFFLFGRQKSAKSKHNVGWSSKNVAG